MQTRLQREIGLRILSCTPNLEVGWDLTVKKKLGNVYSNTKLKVRMENKEPADYGTDEEFGEETEIVNEHQQEADIPEEF